MPSHMLDGTSSSSMQSASANGNGMTAIPESATLQEVSRPARPAKGACCDCRADPAGCGADPDEYRAGLAGCCFFAGAPCTDLA